MKKVLSIALFTIAAKFAAFGVAGSVAMNHPETLGVSGAVATYAPQTLGLAGAIASEETAFGVVGAAFADPTPVPSAEMAPADVQKWLTFFDKLVNTVVNTQ